MRTFLLFFTLLVCILSVSGNAIAAGGAVKSPTGTAPDRYDYYPGTEELKKDEKCI